MCVLMTLLENLPFLVVKHFCADNHLHSVMHDCSTTDRVHHGGCGSESGIVSLPTSDYIVAGAALPL